MFKQTWFLVAAPLIAGVILALGITALHQTPDTSNAAVPTLAVLPSPTDVRIISQPTQDSIARQPNLPVLPSEPTTLQAHPNTQSIANAAPMITESVPSAMLAQATNAPIEVALPQQAVPNQIVIKFAPDANAQERQAYVEQLGGQVVQHIDALDTVVVEVPSEVTTLPESPVVTNSEPDYYVSAQHDGSDATSPNDPLFPEQWALSVIGAAQAWHHLPADAPKITVAVIDSGICDHEELNTHVTEGWDFIQSDSTPQDDFGHGCAVTGIIAANINDGVGMAGIAPNVQIMPLRVLDSRGLGTYSDVAAAITYAVDHIAKIINISLGGAQPSTMLQEAVDYAASHGVVVVAAAGNTGSSQLLYPAAYDSVVAVGSIDSNLEHSSFSNYGPGIDLWAPGRDILTTSTSHGYTRMTGTSFAAPQVAGIAVLELAEGRALTLNHDIVTLDGLPVVIAVTPTAATPVIGVTPTTVPTTAPAPALFIDTTSQGALNMATNIGVMRTRNVQINFDAISNTGAASAGVQSARTNSLLLNLFPDVILVADNWRVDPHSTISDGFVWVGKIEGDEDGEVVLVVADGEVEGHVLAHGNLYQIANAGSGLEAVNQIDINTFGSLHVNSIEVQQPRDAKALAHSNTVAQTAGSPVVDVMVLYTPLVRNRQGGTTAIVNTIQAAVSATNDAYINSGIDQRMNLVYSGEIAYNEVGGNGTDLYNLTDPSDHIIDSVHTLRNTYGADLVVLIAETGNYCGIAWQMGPPPGTDFEQYAFSVVVRDCLPGGLTFAHETGHNMGNGHDLANAVAGAYPYSYGYQDPGGSFRDIMAYYVNWCNPCTQINYYSNTTRTFGGKAMGVADQIDLARSMNNTANIVAAFRPHIDGPAPANDGFANAQTIATLPADITVTNIQNSVADVNDPTMTCVQPNGRSNTVWFKFTPTFTQTMNFSTAGSNYDTVIGVYTGNEGSLTEIACNDDSQFDTTSSLDVDMNAGTTYRIMVANWGGAPLAVPGTLQLTVQAVGAVFMAMPNVVGPIDGASSSSQQPTFSWSPVAGATSYELELSRTNPPTETITLTSASYKPPAPLLTGTYYWRVRAIGPDAVVPPWSGPYSVVITSPNALPARNFYGDTRTPTLTWGRVSWAKGYRIQVDNTSTFSSPEFANDNLSQSTLSVTTTTLANGLYYWRVCAVKDDGSCGTWSAVDTFMIDLP